MCANECARKYACEGVLFTGFSSHIFDDQDWLFCEDIAFFRRVIFFFTSSFLLAKRTRMVIYSPSCFLSSGAVVAHVLCTIFSKPPKPCPSSPSIGNSSGLPPKSHFCSSLSGAHTHFGLRCNVKLCVFTKQSPGVFLLQKDERSFDG